MKNPYDIFLEDYLIENHHLSSYDLKKTFHCLNPEHTDEHPSMHLSKNKNYCHCFACGKTYDIVSLVMQDKECSYNEAMQFLEEKYKNQIQDRENLKEFESKYNLNKKSSIRNLGVYELDKNASEYLKNRGIKYADVITKTLRLKLKNNELYIPHIHLNDNNELICTDYIIRNLNPNAETRYKRQAGVNSSTYSFPFDNINKNTLLKREYDNADFEVQFVTEGEIDMATLFDLKKDFIGNSKNITLAYTALSSTGNVNKYINLINEMGENRKPKTLFILCLDNDNAGKQTSDVLKGFFVENNLLFYDASYIYKEYKDINEAIQKDRNKTQDIFNKTLNEIENIYYKEKGKLYLNNYIENGKIIDENHKLTIPFLHCTTFRFNKDGKVSYESKDTLDIRVLFNPNDGVNKQFNDLLSYAKEYQKQILDENLDNDVAFYLNTGFYQINKNETNNISDLMAFLVSKKILVDKTEYPLDCYAEFNSMNDGYHYLEVDNKNLEKIYMQSLNNTKFKQKTVTENGIKYSQIKRIEVVEEICKSKEQERDFE